MTTKLKPHIGEEEVKSTGDKKSLSREDVEKLKILIRKNRKIKKDALGGNEIIDDRYGDFLGE